MSFAKPTSIAVLVALIASTCAKDHDSHLMATTTAVPPDLDQSIYFMALYRGVSAISLETNEVRMIANSSETLVGITYDSTSNQLYWCSNQGVLYRSNVDGTEAQNVITVAGLGETYALAFDFISGNIYLATYGGHVLACGPGATGIFNCFTVLDGQSGALGLTLDPNEGSMYWTRSSAGSIHSAGMDGSNPVTLVTGLEYPVDVTLDFDSRRLFWTEYDSHKIQSSKLDGSDVQLVIQLASDSFPWGILVLRDRIYWGDNGKRQLQSGTMDGQDIQVLHNETYRVDHMTLVPAVGHLKNRPNDCEGRDCAGLCVLSPTSYRCLE